jgi:hypothetical protein
VFVAAVERDLCACVEDELIWQGRRCLTYNNQGKRIVPVRRVLTRVRKRRAVELKSSARNQANLITFGLKRLEPSLRTRARTHSHRGRIPLGPPAVRKAAKSLKRNPSPTWLLRQLATEEEGFLCAIMAHADAARFHVVLPSHRPARTAPADGGQARDLAIAPHV